MKKKMILMVILGVVLFGFACTPVLARNISSCDSVISESVIIDEKIPNVVSALINVIKIVVPILLVIFGMIDLMKGITSQKEDEIKKGQQIFIKRLISGAIVFFVFVIVQLIISFVAGGDNKNIMTCAKCFINGDCSYRADN